MATIRFREGRGYSVIWKEPQVVVDAQGVQHKRWVSRERSAPDHRTAERLRQEVEQRAALGLTWVDTRAAPVTTIGTILDAFVDMSAKGNLRTAAFRASTLEKFRKFAGQDRPASELSTELLIAYASDLKVKSVARYVGLVEQVWEWAARQKARFPGVPEPERVTGKNLEVRHSPPRVATDNPTWAEVDKMIAELGPKGPVSGQGFGYRPQWEWHRRVAIFQRYTGLRISQIVGVQAKDVDILHRRMLIRADTLGSKGQSRDVIVPIHDGLVSCLKEWNMPGPMLFARVATKGNMAGRMVVPRGAEVAEVFKAAWERSGVNVAKWGAVDRDRGRPTNAIRACWKSAIAGAADYSLAALMVGQNSEKAEHFSYVAVGNPEASPYWKVMREALTAIPLMEKRAPWD